MNQAEGLWPEELLSQQPAGKNGETKRGRGRPAGSKNRPKQPMEELLIPPTETTSDGAGVRNGPREGFDESGDEECDSGDEEESEVIESGSECSAVGGDVDVNFVRAALQPMLKQLAFGTKGTADRTLAILVRDTSPSEMPYEEQFLEGGNTIAPVLAADPIAAHRVDMMLLYAAEDLRVVSCAHAKDFVMPSAVEYGIGTFGTPWFRKIPLVVRVYREHLVAQGIGVANVVIVLASDYLMGDQFAEALQAFRQFQQDNPDVIVIPAGYGDWVPEIAEKVSIRVKPIDLNRLNIRDFIKFVANSVRELSYSRPEDRARLVAQVAHLNAPLINLEE